MQLLLKVISGAKQETKISLRDGQAMQIGRTEWADCAFPEDVLMSSIHFSVECGIVACVVRDLKSTNGTYINGAKKREAVLADGDEIRAGNTVFAVTIEGAPPTSSVSAVAEVGTQLLKTIPDFDADALRAHTLAGEPAAADPSPPLPTLPLASDSPSESAPVSALPHGPASQLVLDTLTGFREGQRILLRAGETATVGRTERADLAVSDDFQISSIHFSLDWQEGNFRIRDLGSTNGTTVNDHLVAEAILQDGDRIRAGRTQFAVHIEYEAASEHPSRQTVVSSISGIIDTADVEVRRVALWSAAWAKQGWVLDYCRRLCDNPKADYFDAMYLLGVLGRPVDLSSIKVIGSKAELGPFRFQALGAFGHPDTLELILQTMAEDDANDAASAGEAFERITGLQLDWRPNGKSHQEQATQATEPSPEEIMVPDAEQARSAWEKLQHDVSACTRICRGFDLSRGCDENIRNQLDMQSRYESILRDRISGLWNGRVADLERFPLSHSG
jgi:pSer/pThr/pTyr-binding forkhead associated (FHA) protein